MPKINIEHKSKVAAPLAMNRIKEFFETDKDLQKLDPKISCEFDPKSMTAKVKGSQFKADVSVIAEGASSQVQIVIDLPLLLTPFKGKVEDTVKKKLSLLLA
jgi:hypothetical protein